MSQLPLPDQGEERPPSSFQEAIARIRDRPPQENVGVALEFVSDRAAPKLARQVWAWTGKSGPGRRVIPPSAALPPLP
jgi:hypothetical protein